jgi:hypothetical protein
MFCLEVDEDEEDIVGLDCDEDDEIWARLSARACERVRGVMLG